MSFDTFYTARAPDGTLVNWSYGTQSPTLDSPQGLWKTGDFRKNVDPITILGLWGWICTAGDQTTVGTWIDVPYLPGSTIVPPDVSPAHVLMDRSADALYFPVGIGLDLLGPGFLRQIVLGGVAFVEADDLSGAGRAILIVDAAGGPSRGPDPASLLLGPVDPDAILVGGPANTVVDYPTNLVWDHVNKRMIVGLGGAYTPAAGSKILVRDTGASLTGTGTGIVEATDGTVVIKTYIRNSNGGGIMSGKDLNLGANNRPTDVVVDATSSAVTVANLSGAADSIVKLDSGALGTLVVAPLKALDLGAGNAALQAAGILHLNADAGAAAEVSVQLGGQFKIVNLASVTGTDAVGVFTSGILFRGAGNANEAGALDAIFAFGRGPSGSNYNFIGPSGSAFWLRPYTNSAELFATGNDAAVIEFYTQRSFSTAVFDVNVNTFTGGGLGNLYTVEITKNGSASGIGANVTGTGLTISVGSATWGPADTWGIKITGAGTVGTNSDFTVRVRFYP